MNQIEKEMVEILKRGKDQFGVVSTKAEFEAEGTRIEELMRLMDISSAAGLPLTVKIGGQHFCVQDIQCFERRMKSHDFVAVV